MHTLMLCCYRLEILSDFRTRGPAISLSAGSCRRASSPVHGALMISLLSSLAGMKTEVWRCPSSPMGKWKIDGASLADAFFIVRGGSQVLYLSLGERYN